jgi:sugar phosphate isomerase/epimerase
LVEIEYRDVAMPTADFIAMAKETGYDGVELRITQVPDDADSREVGNIRRGLSSHHLRLTRLLTHNVDEKRWDSFQRYVHVAQALGAESVGIWVVNVEWTQKACDHLGLLGLPLVLQTHSGKFIGTPEDCHKFLADVGRDNLLYMYDPSHFYSARKPYGPAVIESFKGKIFCGGFQKYGVETDAAGKLQMFSLPWDSPRGVQFEPVVEGFRRIGCDGFITVIEPYEEGQDARERARYFAQQLRRLLEAG